MPQAPTIQFSTVSVVIPCYNHAHYLSKAIESVLAQTYPHLEIVVVDDGSADNTRQVAQSYAGVKYVHKQNGGLSAARNTGTEHCSGGYVVFLDADDWLYPEAIATNLRYLQQNPQAAFVSGAHDKIFEEKEYHFSVTKKIIKDHYQHFLSKGNYIGVPAAVLYQRWVLDEVRFDVTLKACEDYDLYLRIARKYPVLHHTEKVAAYRIHSSSMSSNSLFMLHAAFKVLERQKEKLNSNAELLAYKKGVSFWKAYYALDLYKKIVHGKVAATRENLYFILKSHPMYIFKFIYRIPTLYQNSKLKSAR